MEGALTSAPAAISLLAILVNPRATAMQRFVMLSPSSLLQILKVAKQESVLFLKKVIEQVEQVLF
jgi:hypothetical protein